MAFRRWFPRSLVEQARFYAIFTRGFQELALGFGFTAEDVAELEADNAVMQYLALTNLMVKNFRSSFRAMKNHLTLGGEGGGGEPSYIHFAPPAEPPIVPAGMFERLFRLADRIVAADGYTDSTGARLGILPKSSESIGAEDAKLKLRAKTLGSAQVEVKFVRGTTSGINLFMRRAGSEERIDLGRFFHSPAIVKIPLTEAGKPEQIYLFARPLKGNYAVGEFTPMIDFIVAP
jgi:hypothetical protein